MKEVLGHCHGNQGKRRLSALDLRELELEFKAIHQKYNFWQAELSLNLDLFGWKLKCLVYLVILITHPQGECESPCQGVQLGMFSGFGHSMASNKGEKYLLQPKWSNFNHQALAIMTSSGA